MAFFSKLKDKLFKSSSRLEEGLEAIVEDGGSEEAVEPAPSPAPSPAPQTETAVATPEPVPAPAASEEKPQKGLLGRLFKSDAGQPVTRRVLDDDMLEQLEELLIASDMGVDTALRVTSNMAEA